MKRLLCGFLIASSLINAQPNTYASDNAIKKIDEPVDTRPVQQTTVTNKQSRSTYTPPETTKEMQKKNTQVVALVKEGIAFLKSQSLERTCYEFTHTNTFVRGELSLFLIDKNGNYLASYSEPTTLWQNIKDKSENGTLTIDKLFDVVKNNQGWTHYGWNNATRIIYIELIKKNDQEFFVGSGYYSFSQADQIVNLVKKAVATFNQKKDLGRPVADAFSDMNYPGGNFSLGNLTLFAYDFEGNTMASGDDPSSIGTNKIDVKDENGRYLHSVIDRTKVAPQGSWTNYIYKRAPKRSYAEKVTGADGKEYIIGGGYYPTADRKEVITLVDRGYEALKTLGLSQATNDFTTNENNNFRFGDLYLFVYDKKGLCLAHGKNQSFVGMSFYNAKDDHNIYYVQSMLERATPDGAWFNVPLHNSVESIFVRRVNLGTGSYIIGCGIYPASKEETMILLTKSASSFFTTVNNAEVFTAIAKQDSKFTKGDLNIFVFDTNGFCLVHGDDLSVIWQNFINIKDDNGRPFVKTLIESALNGPSQVKYRINNATKDAYVESIKKDGKSYIIGSSAFI